MYKFLQSRSFFIFGARGTGKSTWLREHYTEEVALWIDLLNPDEEENFSKDPERFWRLLEAKRATKAGSWVIVDEIQKVPSLLDYVHKELAFKKHFRFVLTGSSSRKLKRSGANLLAGRAHVMTFFPLSSVELKTEFDLEQVLSWGSLPEIFHLKDSEEKTDFLRAYTQTYLKEEIVVEQLVRNVPAFRRFLDIAAQMSGKILNFSHIARDLGVEVPTVKSYFDILADTFLGFYLECYHGSIRKRQTKHPKFYLFDQGVTRSLLRILDQPLREKTSHYGEVFEQFIILEFIRLNSILKKDYDLSYLSTKDDAEIDLILSKPLTKPIAIEIKSTNRVDEKEVRKFEALAKDLNPAHLYYLSRDPMPQKLGAVECLPWNQGLQRVFNLDS